MTFENMLRIDSQGGAVFFQNPVLENQGMFMPRMKAWVQTIIITMPNNQLKGF